MARLDDLLTLYGDISKGSAEVPAALLSGIAADVPAGLGGLWEFGKGKVRGDPNAAKKAAERVEQLREKFTYQPRSDAGRAGLANVGKGFEWGIEQLKKTPGTQQIQADWDKATIEAPGTAAVLAGLAGVVEPKGARAAGRAAKVAKTAERAAQVAPQGFQGTLTPADTERAAQRAARATELAQERARKAEARAVREAEVGREAVQMRSQHGPTEYDYGPQAVPESIIEMGASKASRDASASRRAVEEAERKAAETGEDVERVTRTAEERAAVPPDIYRQLYRDKGEQAVFDAAQRGEHHRRGPGGELIGFPRDVRTPEDIVRMQGSLDKQLMTSLGAIRYAEDPKRVGNWYERAQQGILETTEPKLLDRTLEAEALHSQGVDPTAQTLFANRYLQSRGIGKPQTGFYGRQAKLLDDARAKSEKAKLAFKVGEYRNKLDAREDQMSPSGVNDFRAAQTYGYTDTSGAPWTSGVTPQMHPVMDAENALTVMRARMAGIPGMTGALVQELPWVLGKSEDLLLRGLHKGDTPLESRVNAIREANKTGADTAFDQAGAATAGVDPGLDTGIHPDIKAPSFTREATDADPHARDILLSATDQRHFSPTRVTGEWMGKTEPNVMNRPLVYSEAGKKAAPGIAPDQLAALKALEVHRGLAGGQSAVAMNFPDTKSSGLTDILLERKGMNRYGNPEIAAPSPDEMVALNKALTGRGYFAVPTQRGALLKTDPSSYRHTPEELSVGPQRPPEPDALLRKIRSKKTGLGDEGLQALLPGSRVEKALDRGFYEPVTPSHAEMGTGVGTSRWLEAMRDAPEAIAQKVGGSKEARDVLKTHIRAVEMAKRKGKDFPDPMMKTLQFMAGRDWPKVVKLAREKGVPVSAAMGLLGFSLEGMAADDQKRLREEEKRYAR